MTRDPISGEQLRFASREYRANPFEGPERLSGVVDQVIGWTAAAFVVAWLVGMLWSY